MAPTIGVNLRVTGHCNQGGRKYMEDAFVVAYQQTEDEKDLEYAYFGIFDGHGGREAALFAKEHLMDDIVNQKNFWSDDDNLVLKAIRDGFITTHLAMWKEVGKWPKTVSGLPSTSGTTSSVAFIRRGKIYTGHVGDSKIVIGYQEPGCNAWLPLSLTKDHKPESPKEKKRIYSVGGLVMNKAGVERVVWNRPRIGHKGPIRRSTPIDQIPFLAVARSLGDLWSYNYLQREFIVSPEPDVCVFTLDPKRDRCIVLASDGLWNMVSTRDAVRIVQNAEEENEQLILEGGGPNGVGKPSNNPSKLLVDKGLNHWFDLRMRADNTSVVTVLLDPPGPPKSEVLLRQKVMQKLRPRDDQAETESQSATQGDAECESRPQKKQNPDVCSPKVSDEVVSAANKEKKKVFNPTESRTSTLPKPVVLSPQRVVIKRAASQNESKSSPHCHSHHHNNQDAGATTKSQDTPKHVCHNRSSNEASIKNSHETTGEQTKDHRKVLSPDLKGNANLENSASNPIPASKEPQEKNQTNKIIPIKENSQNISGSCSKNTSSSGIEANKESARVHLCEVDNIVKVENIDRRISECSKSVVKVEENKAKEVDSSEPKLSAGDKAVSVRKRKCSGDKDQEESEPPVPAKSLRLHSGSSSWRTDSYPGCRVAASRDIDLPHNTRAQQRVRKMKVR